MILTFVIRSIDDESFEPILTLMQHESDLWIHMKENDESIEMPIEEGEYEVEIRKRG